MLRWISLKLAPQSWMLYGSCGAIRRVGSSFAWWEGWNSITSGLSLCKATAEPVDPLSFRALVGCMCDYLIICWSGFENSQLHMARGYWDGWRFFFLPCPSLNLVVWYMLCYVIRCLKVPCLELYPVPQPTAGYRYSCLLCELNPCRCNWEVQLIFLGSACNLQSVHSRWKTVKHVLRLFGRRCGIVGSKGLPFFFFNGQRAFKKKW